MRLTNCRLPRSLVDTRSLGTIGVLRPQKSSGLLPSYTRQKIPFDAGGKCGFSAMA